MRTNGRLFLRVNAFGGIGKYASGVLNRENSNVRKEAHWHTHGQR